MTCWPGSKRNSSRSSSGTAKVTSVLSSVIGSTEATGMRWKTAWGALEPLGIRTGSTLSSLLLSCFHSRYSSGSS